MRRVLAAVLTASVALGMVATPAHAQDTPAEREKKARKHYEDGITQYNIANYGKAIEEFKRAYELTRSPALLFNIAQAYRLNKECQSALTFYRNYVRESPGAPNRSDAELFIKEVEACVAKEATPTPVPQPEPQPQPQPQPTPVEPQPQPLPVTAQPDHGATDPGKTLRLAGWITGGVGLGVFGVGVIYGLKARSTQSTYDECLATSCADLESLESDGNRQEDIGVGGMIAGGVLVAAGATMVVLGWPSAGAAESSAISLAPTADGGAFVWSGRF